MLRLTDLILAPDRSPSGSPDWPLPAPTAALLARVAPTNLPVLCTDCYGVAFQRIADALHARSGREEMVLVDLRRSSGTLPAGLPNGARGTRTTLCLDGIEHLGPNGQEVFASQIARSHYRLICATDATLDELRARWRPDLFALVSTITVRVPALGRRGPEIPALARERIALLCRELDREPPTLTAAAEAALSAHPWSGDTAELDAVLVRSLLASDAPVLDATDLRWEPDAVLQLAAPAAPAASVASAASAARGAEGNVAPRVDIERAPEHELSHEAELERPRERTLEPESTIEREGQAEAAAPPAGVAPPAAQPLAATEPSPSSDVGHDTVSAPTVEALAVELAHQLKNPLVTIKTFVACVESLSEDPHELSQFRALTDEAVTRMDTILDQLLAYARLAPPRRMPLDALAVVRDALREAWRAFAGKQVTLEAPENAELRVVSDPEHLRYALDTLARHVADTIEARGTLRIEVENGGVLRVSYRESGAVTHLRGAATANDSGLPLALLLVRGALGRVGGTFDIEIDDMAVRMRIRLGAS